MNFQKRRTCRTIAVSMHGPLLPVLALACLCNMSVFRVYRATPVNLWCRYRTTWQVAAVLCSSRDTSSGGLIVPCALISVQTMEFCSCQLVRTVPSLDQLLLRAQHSHNGERRGFGSDQPRSLSPCTDLVRLSSVCGSSVVRLPFVCRLWTLICSPSMVPSRGSPVARLSSLICSPCMVPSCM